MNLQEETKTQILDAFKRLKNAIIQNHASAQQIASGETERSLRIEEAASGATLFGRSAFGTLETGRKAGSIPYNFQEVITQWILSKGIAYDPIPYMRKASARWTPKYTPQERGLMSLSGAIAYKIKKEGSKLYREGGRKDIFTPEIEETTASLRKILAGIYKAEIESIGGKDEHNRK